MKDQFIGFHLDFIGFTASALCVIHCVGLPLLLSMTPLAGLSFLNKPWVEYTIILLSFLMAMFSLVSGYRVHLKPTALAIVVVGFTLIVAGHLSSSESMELILTPFGALVIATAHFLNWTLGRQTTKDMVR